MQTQTDLKQDFVATVNSFKKGKLQVTILTHAKNRNISGKLCELLINSDLGQQRVLCRINRVDMANVIHESLEFQQVIADQGRLQYYSGDCDILTAEVEIVACIRSSDLAFSGMACPPKSGTLLRVLHDSEVADYRVEKEHHCVIGHLPDEVAMPMSVINRHFGEWDEGGYGEAKHTCIFGQNGSGKTVLALAVIAAQLAANSQQGCLIPDTAGDISKGGSHSKGDFKFNFIDLLESAGREPEYIKIQDLRLTSKTSFKQLLDPVLRRTLNMHPEKSEQLADRVTEELFEKNVDLAIAQPNRVLDVIIERIPSVYTGTNRKAKEAEALEIRDNATQIRSFVGAYTRGVMQYFEGKYSIDEIIKGFLDQGRIILLNMATMSEAEQRYVMYEIFSKIKRKAELDFKIHGTTRNGLVVLDEGPRWAPQSGEDEVTQVIRDAFNTTRKLGVGWMIISQRITAISKDVIAQCHTKFVGRGMGIGADRDYMKEFFREDGLVMYDQLSLKGGFFWLATGHQVNYGQGSQYVAFETFGGDATQAMKNANPHIWV
jgi:RecA/RadA recombinase